MFHVKHRKETNMLKRFKQFNRYTLCLIDNIDGEIYTWCVNVLYKGKTEEGLLDFVQSDDHFYVDIETKLVSIEMYNLVYVGGDEEYYYIPEIHFATVTNIVNGWQF